MYSSCIITSFRSVELGVKTSDLEAKSASRQKPTGNANRDLIMRRMKVNMPRCGIAQEK